VSIPSICGSTSSPVSLEGDPCPPLGSRFVPIGHRVTASRAAFGQCVDF
jgi:hypothetical protein